MKHNVKVVVIFSLLFILAQIVGLYLINISAQTVVIDGEETVVFADTVVGERPQLTGTETLIQILLGVAIGTAILLLMIKVKKVNWWKTWFLLASWLAVSIALGVLITGDYAWLAWVLGLLLAAWKVYKPNIFIQNITEVLMYAGIAVLIAPHMNVLVGFIVLILFSVYDMYAVWKSKHMVKMAEFTSKADVFPGLVLTYSKKDSKLLLKHAKQKSPDIKGEGNAKTGILGGGDVVFPLLFTGIVMLSLIKPELSGGQLFQLVDTAIPKSEAFFYSMIIVGTSVLSLAGLFIFGKKDRFYPAMPFLTAGCLLGYVILALII